MTEAAGACQERHSPHRRATRPSSAAGRVSLCTHLRPRDRATPIFPMLRVCCWGWCRCGRLSRRLGSTGKAPTLRCPAPTCRLLSLRQCLVCRCCLVALWRVVIGIRGNEWVEIFCIKCSHIAYLGNKIVLVLAGIRVGEMRGAIPSTHWGCYYNRNKQDQRTRLHVRLSSDVHSRQHCAAARPALTSAPVACDRPTTEIVNEDPPRLLPPRSKAL
jgi:hypothetical protein